MSKATNARILLSTWTIPLSAKNTAIPWTLYANALGSTAKGICVESERKENTDLRSKYYSRDTDYVEEKKHHELAIDDLRYKKAHEHI